MFYHWNVIGHEKELHSLESDILNNNIHHAYLFTGPEKIGKYRVAKSLAGILQCPNNFCHTCQTCIQVDKKCHPDTIELEDDGESIKVTTMKDILGRLSMTGGSRYKVLLIQDIGRLTESSMLLKPLEEPTGKTVFIFTAGQLRDVTPTIASRMRIIHFKKLPDDVLRASLKKIYPMIEDEMLEEVLLLSLGRSGKAIQLLSNPEAFSELHDLYHQIQFLDEKAGIGSRLMAIQEIGKDPQKTKTFLSLMAHYFRYKLFTEQPAPKRAATIKILEEIHRVISLLDRNVNPNLLLENLMLQL
jgi:DNA polymerase III gamma/tau subunit